MAIDTTPRIQFTVHAYHVGLGIAHDTVHTYPATAALYAMESVTNMPEEGWIHSITDVKHI